MRILVALTYYRPHVSGLTIYVERLAEGLAARGHQVTVLTSRFDRTLPRREQVNGVTIERIPVALRVSKGVIMPSVGLAATRLARSHDVLSIHLPQIDAPGFALRGRLLNKPAILTYHCDLNLPLGPFNRVVDQVVFGANYAAALLADRIVAYTEDYATHSRLLSKFRSKWEVILPPVKMAIPRPEDVEAFRAAHVGSAGPIVGFASRFATEKGVEYLVEAMPALLQRFPELKVVFAGGYENVIGEEEYWARLAPQFEALGRHWEFLGWLTPDEMPAFFANCNALAVPSLNSTESFGLVQVEGMLCGTPVVASDLPGVRQPIRMTGMGEIVEPRDSAGLADALTRVLEHPEEYVRPRAELEQQFDIENTLTAYEELFDREVARKRR